MANHLIQMTAIFVVALVCLPVAADRVPSSTSCQSRPGWLLQLDPGGPYVASVNFGGPWDAKEPQDWGRELQCAQLIADLVADCPGNGEKCLDNGVLEFPPEEADYHSYLQLDRCNDLSEPGLSRGTSRGWYCLGPRIADYSYVLCTDVDRGVATGCKYYRRMSISHESPARVARIRGTLLWIASDDPISEATNPMAPAAMPEPLRRPRAGSGSSGMLLPKFTSVPPASASNSGSSDGQSSTVKKGGLPNPPRNSSPSLRQWLPPTGILFPG
ncbi:hypothetical protein CDD81_1753 [Ophiocordyceps australis]|uniref:Uncharacterized protein n=1 Tax=Ophiocordyceps australis TaxID=1399860 RepID=A0A2C5YAD5_9HYPO|nr:hypothetical protein CDD81_1753 [Ophiocordyceps australis]